MQRTFMGVFLLLLPVWTEATIRSCPRSWQSFGAYCFKVISGNTQYNYDRANLACQNAGGRLASIHSIDELEYLRDTLVPSGLFYIGLKRNSARDWVYDDTTSVNCQGSATDNPLLISERTMTRLHQGKNFVMRKTVFQAAIIHNLQYDYSYWDTGEPGINDNCVVLNSKTFRWSGGTCYLNVDGALCRKPLDDTEGPQATCVNTTVEVPPSVDSTSVNFVEPVILDESSPVTIISQSNRSGDVFPKGESRVVYTFRDPFFNNGECTFYVIVKDKDTTPPTLNCYDTFTSVPFNSSGKNVSFREPEAFDTSTPVIITLQSHKPGDFFEVGITMVTYNYSDASGNSADCTFNVTIRRDDDLTPPSVNCDNFTDTFPLDSMFGGKNVYFKEPNATDNSGQLTLTSRSHQPGSFFEEGATEVVYTFSDESGNNESCSFYVIVQKADRIPPSVECKNFIEEISKEDQEKRVHFEEPIASDISNHVIVTSQSHHPGDIFPLGETTVTYTFSDGSGNSANCSFTVVVRKEKDIAPELKRIQQYVQANKPTFTLDNVTQVSEELADFTSSDEELSRDEVDAIAGILSDVSSFNSSSPEVTSFVLEVTDNIITADEGNDVISGNSSEVILQSLERQLDNVRTFGKNFTETRQNIAVNVVQVEYLEAPVRYASFPLLNEETNGTNNPEALGNTRLSNDPAKEFDEEVVSIQLDPKALLSYFPSGQKTLPLSLIIHRSDALFHNSKTKNSGLKVNSYVIAASTSMPISNLPTKSLVVATFRPKTKYRLGETQCMFWNHTLHGSLGGWSGEGCNLEEDETPELISCFCNHLTSFAILVNPYGDVNDEFVTILTLIGCIISIICLVLTVVSLSASLNIRRKPPQKILINLSLALLGLYLFFLIGVERSDLQVGCVIFGALIHFFLLASIAWMSVEATNMYLMFVKVLNANVRHFLWKASVFAWGFPLVVVVTSAIVSSQSYASGDNCFPHHKSLVFYISIFAIVILLLTYNVIIFALIVWKLTWSRKNIASASNTRRDTIRRLQNAFAISVLLGMTWTFGLFPIRNRTLYLLSNILFCLFNSLQGFFIFLLFASRQKEVRDTWKKWLHIYKRGEDSTKSTGFTSQTDQGRFGDKKERKMPVSDASAKTDIPSSTTETKGL